MIFLIIGLLSAVFLYNINQGLIWFLLPVGATVVNDISAYFWGRLIGKHKLISLSPKKTVEGYVGAIFTTIVWNHFFSLFLSKYLFILCPVKKIDIIPFNYFNLKCDETNLIEPLEISLSIFNNLIKIKILRIQLHAFFISLFASVFGPLGGFMGSGFKRAIKIKDFAKTIPGHGGIVDRMDCEIINSVFTYVYLINFVFKNEDTQVDGILENLANLGTAEKIYILANLKKMLGE
jgi:phosphatidate cytidylyltransferase